MAKNDYFVVVYRILTYLYECFKAGEKPDIDFYGANALKINEGYWVNVMESLYNEGCITGINIIKITQKGIEYLQENSFMAKAKDFLKPRRKLFRERKRKAR